MRWLLKTVFGSTVYGTNLPTSDTDIKGIVIPDVEHILLQRAKGTIVSSTKKDITAKNNPEDVDTELFALHRYLELLLEGQTVAVDLLFTPNQFWLQGAHPVWDEVLRLKSSFLHSGTASFVGYCHQQANKYGIKGSRVSAVRNTLDILKPMNPKSKLADNDLSNIILTEHAGLVSGRRPNGELEYHLEVCNRKVPLTATVQYATEIFQKIFDQYGARALQAEKNDSVDWKALMHAVRIATQARELLLTGHVTFPRPEAPLLLQIRKGELPYKEVATMIEQGLVDLEDAKAKSLLPPEPDYELAEALVLDAYCDEVVNWKHGWS